MYFKRLDMHGFKSFAEPVSLEFTDGITCIVGPNGSGKSNITDAVRWVLGEQSARQMRGGKMEEVIFAGTENRKARGIAEATLVIDNSSGILPLEYNEVAITRRMYRSGESEYMINHSPCRLKDIRELIMDTGMGVEGYSIIGQGKISEIVNNKAEGRKQLFEEAAGIVRYRTRKNESERKLNTSVTNLDRVNDIINEIEGRIDGLREDSIKAEEYIGLRDRYKSLEINIAVRQAEGLEEKLGSFNSELEQQRQLLDDLKAQKEKNDSDLKNLKDEIWSINADIDSTSSEVTSLSDKVALLRSEIGVSKERSSSNLDNRNRISGEIERDSGLLKEEEAQLDEKQKHLNELTEKISSLKEVLSEKNKEYEALLNEVGSKNEEIEELKSSVMELHSEIKVAKNEISSVKSMREGLKSRKEALLKDIQSSEDILRESGVKKAESEAEMEKLSKAIDRIDSQISELSAKVEINDNEIEGVSSTIRSIDGELHKCRTKTDLLLGFQSAYEGFGQAVRFIMSRRNRFSGIRGTVADLADVPKGYETAIQTAMGGGLQNIVCDNDRTAAEAVKLLKQERAGRATFLPVSSIRGGRNAAEGKDGDSLRREKGFLGFAVEIINFDPEYRGIMEYLLGRIVITDNLDNAVAMSKRYRSGIRFVSLDGDDINPSGAITGGRYRNTGPNTFERKNEIRELEEKKNELEAFKEEAEVRLKRLNETAADLGDSLSEYEEEKKDLSEQMENIRRGVESAGSRSDVISDNVSRWQKEAEDIEREIAETLEMTEDLNKQIEEKNAEIERSEAEVDEKLEQSQSVRDDADELFDEISSRREEMLSLESDQRHGQGDVARLQRSIRDITDSLNSKKEELAGLESRDALAEEELRQAETRLEEAENNRDSSAKKLEELKDRRNSRTREADEAEKAGSEADRRIGELQNSSHELQIKITRSEAQLDSVKNSLWENFEISFLEAVSMKEEKFALSTATRESREIRNRMRELEPVNIGAIEEYKQVSERYDFLKEQRLDLTSAIDSLRSIISEMDRTINLRFMSSFKEIDKEFKNTFSELFGGGFAELKLEDPSNILDSGIEIIAQPPGKKLQNINLLSGGEKSVTAIALLCAILKIKPTPFCILDEAEAALDDINIERFIGYLRKFSNVQFVIVTHQKATMEKADIMYGVTMPEKGVSQVVSLKMDQD